MGEYPMAHLNYSGKVVLRRSLSSLSAPAILMKWLSLLSNSLSPDDNLFISWIESAPTLHLSRGNRLYQGQVIKISSGCCNDDFCLWWSSLSNHTISGCLCCQNLKINETIWVIVFLHYVWNFVVKSQFHTPKVWSAPVQGQRDRSWALRDLQARGYYAHGRSLEAVRMTIRGRPTVCRYICAYCGIYLQYSNISAQSHIVIYICSIIIYLRILWFIPTIF